MTSHLLFHAGKMPHHPGCGWEISPHTWQPYWRKTTLSQCSCLGSSIKFLAYRTVSWSQMDWRFFEMGTKGKLGINIWAAYRHPVTGCLGSKYKELQGFLTPTLKGVGNREATTTITGTTVLSAAICTTSFLIFHMLILKFTTNLGGFKLKGNYVL